MISEESLERLRDAAAAIGGGATISSLLEQGGMDLLDRMEKDRSEPFPPRKGQVRTGRPKTTRDKSLDPREIIESKLASAIGSVPPFAPQEPRRNLAFQPQNHPLSFLSLSEDQRETLLSWIERHFVPRAKRNLIDGSYGLKHYFERDQEVGFYISNGAFKGAMIVAGFDPDDWTEVNPYYRFSVAKPEKK